MICNVQNERWRAHLRAAIEYNQAPERAARATLCACCARDLERVYERGPRRAWVVFPQAAVVIG